MTEGTREGPGPVPSTPRPVLHDPGTPNPGREPEEEPAAEPEPAPEEPPGSRPGDHPAPEPPD
ncbi:hypothetical protein [Streptomyces sp. NPDC057579]|uniref:hypothetical protein n=1 Tax=Streptomyces sp. NPDC057579 TaxID=3346172 RepID=UPI003699F981